MRTRIIKANNGIIMPVMFQKAESSTNVEKESVYGVYSEVCPYTPIGILREIAKDSAIIPQCIAAYQTNIAGFGVEIKSKLDDKVDSPKEIAETEALQSIIDDMHYDMPFKGVLNDIIGYREQSGIAYMEVIRNGSNKVVGAEALDPDFITQTSLGPAVEVENNRFKKFRKFKQMVNGTTVWYKEFGFPKFMNYETGGITETSNGDKEANEIIVFKIGSELYGNPRWFGQSVNIQGSKMAEYVNYNYFVEGRHTPIMLIVKGGTLSEKSWTDLQTYMNDIKGYANSHGFIVLEVETLEQGMPNDLEDEKGNKIEVEIKDLSPMLQKDALFSEYLKDGQRGVQSSFNLPDIYVGKTQEYNRATSYAAMEVTERQVFQPERDSINWILNNKLFKDYDFSVVEVKLKAPKIDNTDDLYKMILALSKAGGITPLVAQSLLKKFIDIDVEDFTEDWASIPLEINKILQDKVQSQPQGVTKSAERQIDILKDVKGALEELVNKYNLREED